MTVKEDYGKQEEPEIAVDAVPAQADTGPPIPPGHNRFYCEKCRAVRCWTIYYVNYQSMELHQSSHLVAVFLLFFFYLLLRTIYFSFGTNK